MKTYIHVNQHVIKRNRKTGASEPVITCKNYKENKYGDRITVYGQDGKVACEVIYSPGKPLSCGAHVYIVTENKVDVETVN